MWPLIWCSTRHLRRYGTVTLDWGGKEELRTKRLRNADGCKLVWKPKDWKIGKYIIILL